MSVRKRSSLCCAASAARAPRWTRCPISPRAGGRRRPIVIADPARVERELTAAARIDARFVFFGTRAYPPLLHEIGGPPPVLAVRGDLSLAMRPTIAVVGARQASATGRTIAREWSEAFGAAGWTVVSGLALGVDTEAHRGSLPTGTVAVVAGGVDRPSPSANLDLAEAIADQGAMVSEMPFGVEAFSRLLVRRNRLIAGLSRGVLVVEAAAHSGSLHTAGFAVAAGREVFAVPGSPLDPRAAGCLQLLKEGATLVTEPRDVLDHLSPADAPMLPGFADDAPLPLETPGDAVDALRQALSPTPVSVDMLVRVTGLPTGTVIATLVELELAGHAEREPNGMVRAALPDPGAG